MLLAACSGGTQGASGTWDLTTTVHSNSCPERTGPASSTETHVLVIKGSTIRLSDENHDYEGTVENGRGELEGPTDPAAGFRSTLSIAFSGDDAFVGEFETDADGCILQGEIAGRRTSSDTPDLQAPDTKAAPAPQPLPELPDDFREGVSGADFAGSWQVLETIDGIPCGDGRYERSATWRIQLAPNGTSLLVGSSEPNAGWGNAIYDPVTASVSGDRLTWRASFPSGNAIIEVSYSVGVTEAQGIAGTGKATYTGGGDPSGRCTSPLVVLGERG